VLTPEIRQRRGGNILYVFRLPWTFYNCRRLLL